MQAVHPVTGKPIRVVKSAAQLWREHKTLVLLGPDSDSKVKWNRWETAACGRQLIQDLRQKGIEVHIPIFIDEESMTFDELRMYSKSAHLIAVSMRVIQAVGSERFQKEPLGNIICLDEAKEIYSYCGGVWNGTAEDAAAILCAILHYSRLAGVDPSQIQERLIDFERMNIECLGTHSQPPELWLIQQYFRPNKAKRAREIRRCLEENLKCPFIDKLVLLNEEDYSDDFPKGFEGKILQKIVGKRLTYEMVIREIYDSVPEDTIAVFSNSDIFLEDSTRTLWSLNLEDKFLSLLRWDVSANPGEPSKLFGPRDDSQDTWILWSSSVKSRTWKWPDLDFPFGKNGCDNAINLEMFRQKFLISNPAYTIKTQHVHTSAIRTYDPKDIVDKPIFLHIAPTGLNDMLAKESWEQKDIFKKIVHTPFKRRLHSVQTKELQTFCTMLKRGEIYDYKVDSDNTSQISTDVVLGLKDCFLTPLGLAYGHHELYVGPTQASRDIWSKTGVSGCQPVLASEFAVAAPLTDKETASLDSFCLQYLPKIFQLRDIDADFLCPKKEEFTNALRIFRWSQREVPVLPQDESLGIYCKKALVWTPSDSSAQVTMEDVNALRDMFLVPWHDIKPNKQKLTIIEDGSLIDSKWIAELEEQLGDRYRVSVLWPGRTTLERTVDVLKDTSVLIYGNTEKGPRMWSWMWMLPEGAKAIEVQNEMDPRGDGIHLAGAGQINHWLVVMRKGLRDPMIQDTVKNVLRTLEVSELPTVETTIDVKKPVVYIPRTDLQGFFGHTGDSFREMLQMWGERGHIDLKVHPLATLCWWNDVGADGVLLYDRPNLDWLWSAPDAETKWTRGLFGNPEPPSGGRSWSFWPRRPRLVEQAVSRGLSLRPFGERKNLLVFYGKIENRVQEQRRTGSDWGSVCDDFTMVKGEDAKYALTQEEYVERLSQAKFGLCLAGFGRKCHREVECMAMGCVPVCDRQVDMTHYARPPVEGTHYIRVERPDGLREKLEAITEEDWNRMSRACREWWRDNVSCDGLFALTQELIGKI